MTTLILAILLAQDTHLEAEPRLWWTTPKFRVRDGESWLAPSSVFSRELDAEGGRLSAGGGLRLLLGDERLSLETWALRAEGDGTVDEPKNFGGRTVAAGTPSDTDVLLWRTALDWRHRFELGPLGEDGPRLSLDPGLALEYLVFDADLGFGATRLDGVFPTPQVSLGFRPLEWLELRAGIGGFYLPFVNGDVDILDPVQYRFSAEARWDRWAAGVGYELYHLHLEENADDPEEDVAHLRLRSLYFSFSVRF